MSRLGRIRNGLRLRLRAWRARRRLKAETMADLVELLTTLRARVDELEADLDHLRADSRRVAELRILVEDFLADRS